MRCSLLATSFLFLTVSVPLTAENKYELETSTDPSGCILEHVAVESARSQYQNDGLLADGTGIAIGWDDGAGGRGTDLLDLTTWQRTALHRALDNGATFSPDGKWITNAVSVADNNTDIVLIDRSTGELSYVHSHEAWDWLPSFSPDGTQILFNSYRGGNSDVYLYTIASGELEQMTSDPTYEAHAKFSPDGKFILYHEQIEGADFNVNLMDLETGTVRALTTSSREESYPSWSPNGRYVVYADDRDQEPGKPDIFIMDLDGNVVSRVTNHPEKDAYPFWSPDGKHLYFNSHRGGGGVYRATMSDMVHCKQS